MEFLQNDKGTYLTLQLTHGMNDFPFSPFSFFVSRFYKIAADSSYFRKKILYLQLKELFDSIATQNAEIRTVANSLPPLFK